MREYYKILSVENKFDVNVTNVVENIFEYSNVFFIYSPLTLDIAIIIRSKKIIFFVHGLLLFLQLQKIPSSVAAMARPETCGLVGHTVTLCS